MLLLMVVVGAGLLAATPAAGPREVPPSVTRESATTQDMRPPGNASVENRFRDALAGPCRSGPGHCWLSQGDSTASSVVLRGPVQACAWRATAMWDDSKLGLARLRVTLGPEGTDSLVFDAEGAPPLMAELPAGTILSDVKYALRDYPTQPGPAEGLVLTLWLNRTEQESGDSLGTPATAPVLRSTRPETSPPPPGSPW